MVRNTEFLLMDQTGLESSLQILIIQADCSCHLQMLRWNSRESVSNSTHNGDLIQIDIKYTENF